MKKLLPLFILNLALSITSCGDLDTENKELVSKDQLENLINASPEKLAKGLDGLLSGNYYKMIDLNGNHQESAGQASINIMSEMMSEDIAYTASSWFLEDYKHRNRVATFSRTEKIWELYYSIINGVNTILDYINRRPDIKDNKDIKNIKGQALAQRAYAYFHLIRLYQHTYAGNQNQPGVPLHTETKTGKETKRNTVEEVYRQITSDLEQAHQLLEGYNRPPQKTNIDQKVVAGLMARVYLTMEKWSDTVKYAKQAHNSDEYPLMNEIEYKKGFSDFNLREVIWAGNINPENTHYFAAFFSHMSNTDGGYGKKLIWRPLYEKIPDTDYRKKRFNDPKQNLNPNVPAYAGLKFFSGNPDFSGDVIWMRSSEMYLIEAEAKARNNDTPGAQKILNELVQKRDTAFDAGKYCRDDLINQILLQRRIELWGEGFAWFDAKRLKKDIDRTTSNRFLSLTEENNNHPSEAQKKWEAGSNDFRFQIPIKEIETGGLNRSDQNP